MNKHDLLQKRILAKGVAAPLREHLIPEKQVSVEKIDYYNNLVHQAWIDHSRKELPKEVKVQIANEMKDLAGKILEQARARFVL